MEAYTKPVKTLDFSRSRIKEAATKSTDEEHKKHRSLAGTVMWLGNGTLPQVAYVASYMQQSAPTLRV